MKRLFSAIIIAFASLVAVLPATAQLVSGPMLGPVELRTAKLWVEVKPGTTVLLQYWKKGNPAGAIAMSRSTNRYDWFSPVSFTLVNLEPNTTYEYKFSLNTKTYSKPVNADGSFTTKELWQWRKPAPDFSFLTGSCAYFNEPVYDRPGKPYGGDSSIFQRMGQEKAAFMLWLGDNWYTREADYADEWGLWARASRDRSMPVLQPLLKNMSHFAMWDDHDYGPNDIGSHYILKETSRNVFQQYWLNTSYGMNNQGIYSIISYGDVDIFMMDDRWWRSADALPDSVNGDVNKEKRMWGVQQMEWLKNALSFSKATFKIIANGSQVLNPASPYEKLVNWPVEYYELMNFLKQNSVNGVLFLTGDRHHSEIIKVGREGTYPLYDITVSPLTSGTHKFSGPEKENPYRVLGIDEKQNYGRFTVSGSKGQRKLTIEFLGLKGEKLGEWSVGEKELKTPR